MKKRLVVVFVVMMLSFVVFSEPSYASDWKHYNQGVTHMKKGNYKAAIVEFKKATAIRPTASTYRQLAISYEKINEFQNAANTYYLEAEIFKKMGDLETYQAVKNKGDALNTEIELFTNQNIQLPKRSLAKYEPEKGMYVGAYVEQGNLSGDNRDKYNTFNQSTNKKHAIFLNYHHYGVPFPVQFAEEVKGAGGAIQLALEPSNGLNAVKDDAYLRQFARDAKAAGVPIFLRFASEMNGDWVAWHGNPALYRQKFALVHQVMKEEAPNVAMVWVPNSVPVNNIDAYYPGDQFVDWVGINLYSVPFFNGDPKKPADHVNPLDLLDEFYNKYAKNKPMMIGEFASSHYSSAIHSDVTQFGITKMKMLYNGLQMKYPNVKAAHWFNVDTINGQNIRPERRLNNYNLLMNPKMKKAYSDMVNEDYFLSDVVNGPLVESQKTKPRVSIPFDNNQTIYHTVQGFTFAKTYDPKISKVVYQLNGKYLSEGTMYPYAYTLNHNQLKAGKNTLTTIIYDSKGREAARKTVTLKKGPHFTQAKNDSMQLFIGDKTVFTEHGAAHLLAPVYQKNGRSLVPLRFISENLGAVVTWNSKAKQIKIERQGQTILLTEGSKSVVVNGKKTTIDVPAEITRGTTFVPLRFITEMLGAKVNYDATTNGIEIKM